MDIENVNVTKFFKFSTRTGITLFPQIKPEGIPSTIALVVNINISFLICFHRFYIHIVVEIAETVLR